MALRALPLRASPYPIVNCQLSIVNCQLSIAFPSFFSSLLREVSFLLNFAFFCYFSFLSTTVPRGAQVFPQVFRRSSPMPGYKGLEVFPEVFPSVKRLPHSKQRSISGRRAPTCIAAPSRRANPYPIANCQLSIINCQLIKISQCFQRTKRIFCTATDIVAT